MTYYFYLQVAIGPLKVEGFKLLIKVFVAWVVEVNMEDSNWISCYSQAEVDDSPQYSWYYSRSPLIAYLELHSNSFSSRLTNSCGLTRLSHQRDFHSKLSSRGNQSSDLSIPADTWLIFHTRICNQTNNESRLIVGITRLIVYFD